jgi:hypothetical protein
MNAMGRDKKEANAKPFALALLLLVAATLLTLAFLPLPALAATPITTCQQLQNMRNDVSGDYYLANDINCSGFDYGDGKGFMPVATSSNTFTGTFDGKGYKITNLYINRPSTRFVSLFGYTAPGSKIKDVGLEEVNVRGSSHVGGLVGFKWVGTITNSYSSGTVTGSSMYVGGLVGYNYDGTITNSYSSGTVTCSGNYVGGLAGYNYDGTITNSYSSGSVSGSDPVGGLVSISSGTITNSYWDTETSEQPSSSGGTGKTTAQMKQQATFIDWDFDTIWAIVEDVTYPYLRWQYAQKSLPLCLHHRLTTRSASGERLT